MIKQLNVFVLLFLMAIGVQAQLKPALHVDGNQLRDDAGNAVVLHGVMDSPNPADNGCRWGILTVDDSIPACLAYFDKVFDALTDSAQGAHANVLRFHLDPAWTNNPNVESDGRYLGDADISRFSPNRLKSYLKNLYWKIISKALKHGMYVIMRPPGICQGEISVNGDYQDYLMTVWDLVSRNDSIRKYPGQISFELANEPSVITDASGNVTDAAPHDFFQPIIKTIRDNGFKGIVWVPGISWSADYRPYIKYPLTDDNMGFAAHDYNSWFDLYDGKCTNELAISKFGEYVPVVRTNPIMITEVDWSPVMEGSGHYDENNNWVTSNYGTWGTATTTGWGNYFKTILDYYQNVGMTVSSTDSYIDMDEYVATGKVQPAFKGVYEACGEPLFAWYKEWAKVNYPSGDLYQTVNVIPDNPFDFTSDCFSTHLLYENTLTSTADANVVSLLAGGSAGWRFDVNGLDLAQYDHMTLELAEDVTSDAVLKIYDTSNFWAEAYTVNLNGAGKTITIDPHNMKTASGNTVNPERIRMVAFSSATEQDIKIKDITLSLPDAIANVSDDVNAEGKAYDLNGRKVSGTSRGVRVVNGKKYLVR